MATRIASSLDVTRLSATIGGVVHGVDVTRPLDPETVAAVRGSRGRVIDAVDSTDHLLNRVERTLAASFQPPYRR